MRNITDKNALDYIAEVLSGKEWSPDTTDAISRFVRDTGREVLDYEPEDEDAE